MTAAGIQWKNSEPDVSVRRLDQLMREGSWLQAITFTRNALNGVRVYLTRQCTTDIDAHLASEPYELGGLMLGRVFEAPNTFGGPYRWLTLIEKTLPSERYKNSSVSLRMETELWGRANKFFQSGLMVVGWYHSHPNLGVFFSGVDRATQAAFFSQPYALGLVIDPVRKQRKCFFGASSEELEHEALQEA